ncbi:MAG: alpha/beta hydrolase [Bacteroidetes bacterium]|nr:alpha/beta hydrolase [Bacteroidota bacterium]
MLSYSVNGKGPRVLLIHGFLETKEMFAPLGLERYFECLKVDVHGHGESNASEIPISFEAVAHGVKEILDKLNWINPYIVGHSMGGYIALELGTMIEFKSLTLFHSNFWTDSSSKQIDRERVSKIALLNPSLFVKETMPMLFLPAHRDSEYVRSAVKAALNIHGKSISDTSLLMRDRKDFSEWVRVNNKRIHFIQGQLDPIVPLDETMLRCKDLAHLYVVENCGHMGQIESPKSIRALLMEIIRLNEN